MAALGLRRTAVPHRNRTPEPAHRRPEGLWTKPGTFTSYLTGMGVHFWNDVQLDFLTLMEVDPRVRGMRARPEAVRWHDGSAWREHFPSFEIELVNGPVLVEVDPAAGRNAATVEAGLAPVRRAAKVAGRRMVVFGRPHIRIQPRLEIAREIGRCAGNRVPEPHRDLVLGTLGFGGCATVGSLAEGTDLPYGECLAAVLNLVWRRVLRIDNGRPLGPRTTVWRAS